MDQFASERLLTQIMRAVEANAQRFETQVVHSRSLGASETARPEAVRLRVLRDAQDIARMLAAPVERALPGAARRFAPGARRISHVRSSVLMLQPGTRMRIDLASEPAHVNDVLLVATLGMARGAAPALHVLRGPLRLAGVDPRRGQLMIPLDDGRAVVLPALRPAEIVAPDGAGARPLLAVVVLARLSGK